MSDVQATPQAIRQLYWNIANDSNERGYARVNALDSLSRLLDLFPRPDRPGFFAGDSQPPPNDPDDPYAVVRMSDQDLDALIAREEAEAAAEAKAKAEAESGDEDDEESNPDEEEPP